MCMYCKHFHVDEAGFKCDAFPDGIPDEIIKSGVPHTEPYEGDSGVQFEPLPKYKNGLPIDFNKIFGKFVYKYNPNFKE